MIPIVEPFESRCLLSVTVTTFDATTAGPGGRYEGLSLSDNDQVLFNTGDSQFVWSSSGGFRDVSVNRVGWKWIDDAGVLTAVNAKTGFSPDGDYEYYSRSAGGTIVELRTPQSADPVIDLITVNRPVGNNHGDLVAMAQLRDAFRTPGIVVWGGGTTTGAFRTIAGLSGWTVSGVGRAGQVVGTSFTEGFECFVLVGNQPAALPLPSWAEGCRPIAVSSDGWVVGTLQAPGSAPYGGIVWRPTEHGYETIELPFVPIDISDTHVVVGDTGRSGEIWSPATGVKSLVEVAPDSFAFYVYATNARGDILTGADLFHPLFSLLTDVDLSSKPDLVAAGLTWDVSTDKISLTYRVDTKALEQDATIALYWAGGDTRDKAIGGPVWTAPADHGTGTHSPPAIDARSLGVPPLGAKTLLLVVNQGNTVEESNPDNNVFSLTLPKPDLVASELRHTKLDEAERGPLAFAYTVRGPVTADSTVAIYWSKGTSRSDIVGGPIYPVSASGTEIRSISRAVGESATFFVPAERLLVRPEGATHVLLVVDPPSPGQPSGLVAERDENNNVLAKAISGLHAQKTAQVNTVGKPSFTVKAGQFTFDAEGNEGGSGQTRAPHWPKGASGVTIGRGYDMKQRTAAEIINDLTKAGVPSGVAKELSKAAKLSGEKAASFVAAHPFTELTPSQQKALFVSAYQAVVDDVKRISAKADVVKLYGAVNWSALNPSIKAILFDLRYRGDYDAKSRGAIQKYVTVKAGKKDGRGDYANFTAAVGRPGSYTAPDSNRNAKRVKYLQDHNPSNSSHLP